MQCDGSDEADVLHRMAIAHTTFRFGSLIVKHRADHRLSRMPACRGLLSCRYTVRCNRADIAVSVSWYNDIEP